MDYKRTLLDRLLDKYERSQAYIGNGSLRRRVMLKLDSSEFPEYDIEKNEVREIVNSIIYDLRQAGIVDYEWLKHEQGNIINIVWLQLNRVSEAYRYAGRIAKSDKINSILEAVNKTKEDINTAWIKQFMDDVVARINSKRSVSPLLPDDIELSMAILKALKTLNDCGQEEQLERVFSIKCYGDSKYFERNIKRRLISIVSKYLICDSDVLDNMNDDEIMEQIGIVRAPEQVEFCGGILGRLDGKSIDFSVFKYGTTINSRTIKDIEITGLKDVNHVLFIENKANYVEYILKKKKDEEIVILHGGFYSPVKGLLFKKVYVAGLKAGVSFSHWGDIDVGGFWIFQRLKQNIIPDLKPLLMDNAAFISGKQYWKDFDNKYADILRRMYNENIYKEFHGVIEIMLDKGAKLEQESFL